jgi:hypothetical protein
MGRVKSVRDRQNTKVTEVVKRRLTTVPKKNRTFDVERHGITAVTDESSGLRRLETDPQSIVVAIGGSCRENGLSSA